MASDSQPAVRTGLLGLLLVTRSRPGPKLVFHYPAELDPPLYPAHQGAWEDIDDDDDEDDNDDDEKEATIRHGTHTVPRDMFSHGIRPDVAPDGTDHIFGHAPNSLEKLLSPGRWCDQRTFEVCMNEVTFVGFPVYAMEHGGWSDDERVGGQKGDLKRLRQNGDLADSLSTSVTAAPTNHDFTRIPASLDSQVDIGLAMSVDSTSTTSGVAMEQMAMFHVAFAIKPPAESPNETVLAYRRIAKTLSKALHHCQKQSNYVTNQSRTILSVRTKAKQLYNEKKEDIWSKTVETSELAWAFKEIYERLSLGEIARIRLNGMEMSLQLNHNLTGPILGPFSGLLLLEAKESLLLELSHPDASPLAQFIREHSPTKSLQKHALNLVMSLNDVLYLARHLIEWRKARVIVPLHQHNVYVVAPSASLSSLEKHAEKFARQFPTLPSLPNMLKVLSGKPIKYGMLVPSRDHRGPYMEILAYLIRHDFVVQLRSLGWLCFTTHLNRTKGDNAAPQSDLPHSHLSPYARLAEEEDAVSVKSDGTTIPLSHSHPRPCQASVVQALETRTTAESSESANAVVILDPTCPNDNETRLIADIERSSQDVEFRQHFSSLLPYLNGQHVLEGLAPRLGLKRAKLEEWLTLLEERGSLRVVRYL